MPEAARLITRSYESKERGMRGRDTTQLKALRNDCMPESGFGSELGQQGMQSWKFLAHSVIAFYSPMLHALAPHLFYAVNGVRAVTAAAEHHL